ncbi:MBL fold metallo-hydrolase [Entomospira culicis]|uniref:MBL fold metallo-hydrolase n=1 Tax=Entomospira culicis TaxID=2719989 RepID=A0A968GGM2_9SPIO|nr:MBL fold metallo-hydrolase [Entomospira culicis]NIZ19629.1 MBL fold metallo-hydrolase [Entomospira culicis]NIZ69466.1 MBL fold metallo-hydrolase [Entomospira culicis]WDI36581.1 MBL fold metallo-hydrolase [Entomospira culicis]WDI38209.1 MBL fold metallo-hydrolase [Entomospira culicis]
MQSSISSVIQALAKAELSPARYQHSARVVYVMKQIHKRLHLPIEIDLIELAGWAHDIAREWPEEVLASAIQKYHRTDYLSSHAHPALWHAIVAMPYIQEQCGFYHPEVDQAVIHHSTAVKNNSLLGKLLFIADECEPARDHLTPTHHLMLAHGSLDDIYYFIIKEQIKFFHQINQSLSHLTLDAYKEGRDLMQKTIKSFHQNPFKENTYLLIHEQTMLIVDPGVKVEELAPTILASEITEAKIIYTHGHFDHIVFGYDLEQFLSLQKIPYESYAPSAESFYFGEKALAHIQDVIKMYGLEDFYHCKNIPTIQRFLEDAQPIDFLDFIFYHTPGHSMGSGVFYSKSLNTLFSGDTIFANGSIGRTDFPDSSPQQMEASLQRIFSLFPSETTLYPGHGMRSTIAREREIHREFH